MTFKKIRLFFNETVWKENIENLPFLRRVFYRILRIGYIVVKGFRDERLNQQAAALTYVSFLSLIPLMAVLFSMAKGFGFQEKVEPWVREALQLVDPDILDRIINYVSATNVAALGAIGFLVLIWTVLKTLLFLEKSFNQIWSVNNARPLYRALAYYLSVVLIVPLLVAASTTLMAMLRAKDPEAGVIGWLNTLPGGESLIGFIQELLPFFITWVAFSLVFAFMVNTNVRLFAAVGGAFVTSLLWNFLQWLYIETQILISKNPIYGTFAFLPIFLVYLYLCWLILLFGCRIAFALQNESAFRRDKVAKAAGIRYRAAAGLLALREVAQAFDLGKKPEKIQRLAERLDLPLPLVLEVFSSMERAGILHQVEGEEKDIHGVKALVPARAPEKILVSHVFSALEGGEGTVFMPDGALQGALRDVLEKAEKAREAALEGVTLQDLLGDERKAV